MLPSAALTDMRITLCTNDTCVLRKSCYRAQAEPQDGARYRRFDFEEKYNQVTCEHQIAVAKLPAVEPEEKKSAAHDKEFINDAFARALDAVQVLNAGDSKMAATKKKKKTRVTHAVQCDRVRIIRDAIRAGKNNRDIYAACKKETGFAVAPNMVSAIRNGTYTGWGADLLQVSTKVSTSDAPVLPKKAAAQASDFNAQIRWLVCALPSQGLEKLILHADGTVEAESIKRQSWNVRDA
jgi:hypothetical protein